MHHWVYCRAIFQNVAKKLGSSREENNILCLLIIMMQWITLRTSWYGIRFFTLYNNIYKYLYISIYTSRYIYIYIYLVQIVCEYQPYRTAILPWNNPNILSISGFRWVPFKQLMWFVNQRSPYLSSMYTFIQNVTIKFQNSKDEF